jgi:hypothetical protein
VEEVHVVRRSSWPVTQDDLSERPNGCRQCGASLGAEHVVDCARRKRTVVVRMQIEYVIEVPEHWTEDHIEFHRNESTWCAGNAQSELDALFEYTEKQEDCVCLLTKCEFVREATEDDEDKCGVRIDPARTQEASDA